MSNPVYMPKLKKLYRDEVRLSLTEKLGLKNTHETPRIEKIVVSVGLGRSKEDNRAKEVAVNTLRKITGQQPVETAARKSIAGFKLREGQKIGAKVTLRGERMYEFLERLIDIVLPRVRDFHGVSVRAFDRDGNYNLGIEDQSVFPELSFDDISLLHGLEVTIVIKGSTPERSFELLSGLGMPFEKSRKVTPDDKGAK